MPAAYAIDADRVQELPAASEELDRVEWKL